MRSGHDERVDCRLLNVRLSDVNAELGGGVKLENYVNGIFSPPPPPPSYYGEQQSQSKLSNKFSRPSIETSKVLTAKN